MFGQRVGMLANVHNIQGVLVIILVFLSRVFRKYKDMIILLQASQSHCSISCARFPYVSFCLFLTRETIQDTRWRVQSFEAMNLFSRDN